MESDRVKFYPEYGLVYNILKRERDGAHTKDISIGRAVYIGTRNLRSIYGGKVYVFLFRDKRGNIIVYNTESVFKLTNLEDTFSLQLGTKKGALIPEKETGLADKILKDRGL